MVTMGSTVVASVWALLLLPPWLQVAAVSPMSDLDCGEGRVRDLDGSCVEKVEQQPGAGVPPAHHQGHGRGRGQQPRSSLHQPPAGRRAHHSGQELGPYHSQAIPQKINHRTVFKIEYMGYS